LGASNWLESVAPIFLNRLADFCLTNLCSYLLEFEG